MPRPHKCELACEFVVSVLKICPDQMNYYMPYLKDSLKPRLSSQWLNALKAVMKVYFKHLSYPLEILNILLCNAYVYVKLNFSDIIFI